MTTLETDDRTPWATYKLLIIAAVAIVAGRIAVVRSFEGDTAFLSANDRSRWCTIASLVEHGTYEIDKQIAIVNPIHRHRRPWQTIDKVQHRGANGQLHYYSSKPPLLPTMIAWVAYCVQSVTGMTMTSQPLYVPRVVLALVNLPMLGLLLICTISVMDRICKDRWAKLAGAIAACFATMLLPFAVSLSNHLPAAMATAVAMWAYFRAAEVLSNDCEQPNRVPAWLYFVAGLAAAFGAANELPALSMTVFWGLLFALLDRKSIVPVASGMAVVVVAFFATNWMAHQSLRPPYAHRGNGEVLATWQQQVGEDDLPALPPKINELLVVNGELDAEEELKIERSDEAGRWRVSSSTADYALLQGTGRWQLCRWDDWYEYPGTYWKDGNRRGVDRGEPSRAKYLFHATLGHYGVFSLTPIWLVVPVGMLTMLFHGKRHSRLFAVATTVATLVCFAFYMMRPMIDRNYGGVSVCFRWLLWFAPLWLAMVASNLDRVSNSVWLRRGFAALLAISVISMSTALSTPWQSPWLYRYWQFLGWIAE